MIISTKIYLPIHMSRNFIDFDSAYENEYKNWIQNKHLERKSWSGYIVEWNGNINNFGTKSLPWYT